MLILNIMNDIAYNSSNQNTISALNEVNLPNTNYKIQNLMMWENHGDTNSFVNKAIELYNEFSANPFGKDLISQIAYKHIINAPKIDRREIDRLVSGGVLNNANKRQFLIQSRLDNEN